MDTEKIIAGNKLIAKFIGLTFKSPIFSDKSFCPGYYNDKNKLVVMSADHFSYHKSWVSLMPVLEVLKQLKKNEKQLAFFNLTSQYISIFDEVHIVWEHVISFIEIYKKTSEEDKK